ncbi:hypothetical protein LCGC14_1853920 [marine sediment metagenome]|uniref:Uncharacterized protein n=1 Tax=marine sediment metagenome TaxID=412755 RepID=A0A0F9J8R3_9ZZZZ
METIKKVLMNRDGMSAEEADNLIDEAKSDLHKHIKNGEIPEDICEEWFGLELDYIDQLF